MRHEREVDRIRHHDQRRRRGRVLLGDIQGQDIIPDFPDEGQGLIGRQALLLPDRGVGMSGLRDSRSVQLVVVEHVAAVMQIGFLRRRVQDIQHPVEGTDPVRIADVLQVRRQAVQERVLFLDLGESPVQVDPGGSLQLQFRIRLRIEVERSQAVVVPVDVAVRRQEIKQVVVHFQIVVHAGNHGRDATFHTEIVRKGKERDARVVGRRGHRPHRLLPQEEEIVVGLELAGDAAREIQMPRKPADERVLHLDVDSLCLMRLEPVEDIEI